MKVFEYIIFFGSILLSSQIWGLKEDEVTKDNVKKLSDISSDITQKTAGRAKTA